MLEDSISMTGALKIIHKDASGVVIHEQETKNLVVTAGKQVIAGRLGSTSPAAMTHMAIGSGTTAAAASQTALVTELGRVALTSTQVSGTSVTYTATFPAGTGTGAVTEAGLFNDPSAGSMLARTVFSVVNKSAADSITIIWTVTVN